MTDIERPIVVIVSGLPGSGKTSLASALACSDPRLLTVSADQIRRSYGAARYDEAETLGVYATLGRQAIDAIHAGRIPVLESTFSLRRYRQVVLDLLTPIAPHLLVVQLQCDIELCRRRLRDRRTVARRSQPLIAFEAVVASWQRWEDCELPPMTRTLELRAPQSLSEWTRCVQQAVEMCMSDGGRTPQA